MKRWSILLLILLSTVAMGQTFPVASKTLKNGMKVIVQEDRSIPNVALYIFYRIGSRNERPGTTGLSHFFEHMMFNGAKKYGPKQLDVVMEAAGGSNNAYTNQNVTVYQDWFPRSIMDLIFDIEADRIQYLNFDPKMIDSERGVVASERRTSVDADNFGALWEQLWASAYIAHPYQWPVVGWMVDIENWKMEDLKHHFEMGYSPSNATMVVSGAVSAEEVFAMAEKYIEPIPTHDPPPKVTTQEPPQQGERRVELKKFAQLPMLMIGYHMNASSDPDWYPFQVLETLLFTGESSRLYRRLVDQDQSAISVQGGSSPTFDPGLFVFIVQPKADADLKKVEAAIYEELDRFRKGDVTDQDLEKAKNLLLANFYRDMKTINGRANLLGTYEVFFGDYQKLFNAANEYNKVTKEDLKRIADKYFKETNRTVATLVPTAEEQK